MSECERTRSFGRATAYRGLRNDPREKGSLKKTSAGYRLVSLVCGLSRCRLLGEAGYPLHAALQHIWT